MRGRISITGLVVVSLLGMGCTTVTGVRKEAEAHAPNATKQRAAFDLGCPEDQLTIVQLAETQQNASWRTLHSYGVTGCGKKASYLTECGGKDCTAALNSPIAQVDQ